MTTFTTSGYSRVLNWDTHTYGDYESTQIEFIRQDGDNRFVYAYNWIDESGASPYFVQTFDPWSHSAIITRDNDVTGLDVINGSAFVERQIFAVDWGVGKTTYVLATFQPVEGIENFFVIGGDDPGITGLASLNAFLANPHRYVLEGEFEGGLGIALGSFLDTTASQNDRVTAIDGLALRWDAGVGNDTMTGGLTDDRMLGGAGNDVMATGGGSDTMFGDLGNDTLTSTGNHSNLMGGAGDDRLIGGSDFGDQLDGSAGNDRIELSDGNNIGGIWVSHSHASGGSGQDSIFGGLSSDNAHGGNGADVMYGYEADDMLQGGFGNDTILGGSQNDSLDGNGNDDSVTGGTGNDIIAGGDGLDALFGEDGLDSIEGGAGNDRLYGGNQNDRLDGGDGSDLLRGDAGNDTLLGGLGNDTLQGSTGVDSLFGMSGADTFRFLATAESPTATPDRILGGFTHASDKIDLAQIDAQASLAGNQTFTVVGAALPFSAEGQIRISTLGADTMIEVNTTGAGGAEMMIMVIGATGITAGDFIL